MKNNKFLKVFLLLLISILMISTGCANKKKPTRKELRESGIINSFEKLPSETEIGDFALETNGYVELSQSRKNRSNGRYSAKAVFSTPAAFVPESELKNIKTWESPITQNINTLTELEKTDWSPYRVFLADVFSEEEKTRDFYVNFVDSQGKEYTTAHTIEQGRNRIEVPLEEVSKNRVDLSNIVSLSLYLDTKDEPEDVILYIDYIRILP
ncbi:MAG: hypothetical protein ACLFP1_04810 [Candidatus Goldiibacteriota bacterium]